MVIVAVLIAYGAARAAYHNGTESFVVWSRQRKHHRRVKARQMERQQEFANRQRERQVRLARCYKRRELVIAERHSPQPTSVPCRWQ